jgi:Flp pilus assembly protein protease CpaA
MTFLGIGEDAMTHWTILFAAACLITALAGLLDWRTGYIPNRLTLPLLVFGIPAHVLALHYGAPALSPWLCAADAVAGALVCSAVPLVLWRYGGMGGGDLKLFAALGSLLGVRAGLEVQLVAFIVAALAAPAVLAFQGRLLVFLGNLGRQLIDPFLPASRRRAVPPELMTEVRFGPVIFAGTFLVACAHL